MKTNRNARGFLKIRTILFCLTVAGLILAEIKFADDLVARFAPATNLQTSVPQPPTVNLGELMAAAR